ncbi:MAG: hypothetical protein JSS82_07290 [Bacteroidetes bacterium]|nr:hypothetical protein [Bacteroidota bacterium]
MKGIYATISGIAICALLYSCSNNDGKSRGPIVMGDSNTIVTERDSQYLRDFVTDINPPEPKAEEEVKKDTTAPTQQPTAQPAAQPAPAAAPQPAAAQNTGAGLTIAFKEVTIFIPGVSAKVTSRQDLQKANGATYRLQTGNLNGAQIKMNGATITSVAQKYETDVAAKNNLGTLWLDDLAGSTPWQALKGGSNVYTITGLDPSQLATKSASPAAVRNAIARSIKASKLNRKKQQDWQNALRNVHSVRQKPIVVSLASVTWKIEGKDAHGKSFQKQVRIDMPQ